MAVSVAFGIAASAGHASPPPNHDHFLNVAGNDQVVQVGPPVCDNPDLHHAFHKFHSNVHVGTPTDQGLVVTAILCQ